MSVPNNTSRDSSFDESDETRRESYSTATTDSETEVYGYNRDSRREKYDEKDYRNQMIDLPELLVDQDMDDNVPRVEHVLSSGCIGNYVDSHADSVVTGDTSNIVEDTDKKNKLTTSCNRQKKSDLIKRYCSKCKKLVVGAKVYKKQLCAICETPLSYQCARCDKHYISYDSLVGHLDTKCNSQNLNLTCSLCEYQTHSKIQMRKHLTCCLSGISFSCGFCVYDSKKKGNLLAHMISMHKDILKIDCSRCKPRSSICKQCRNMVAICESCHTGFRSTGRFKKHQKSCKQAVLKCKYCSYKTNVNSKLRSHMKLEHLRALISQALPTQD